MQQPIQVRNYYIINDGALYQPNQLRVFFATLLGKLTHCLFNSCVLNISKLHMGLVLCLGNVSPQKWFGTAVPIQRFSVVDNLSEM